MDMNYPIWHVPFLGGGLVIAIIAILHVCISHFAIGGGLYVVVLEKRAYRRESMPLLEIVKKNSLVLLLLSTVLGALSGVGIWFSISLVHPMATSALIHNFVWGWAIEWVFFILEITAILMYYETWDKVSRKTHLLIGWIYFIAAYLSLVVINGIVTFMLTPGGWIESHSFWAGIFNPTYFPSLVLRTGICFALGGLYALAVMSFGDEWEGREDALRLTGMWCLASAVLIVVGLALWAAFIPETAQSIIMGGSAAISIFFVISIGAAGLIAAILFFTTLLYPKSFSFPLALVLLLISFVSFGGYEMVREGVRKPYVIYDYMYSNGIRTSEIEKINREGILAQRKWVVLDTERTGGDMGRAVFEASCGMCHELDGYNPVRPMIKGWSRESITHFVDRLDEIKQFMPPFVGTEEEKRALEGFLAQVQKGEER